MSGMIWKILASNGERVTVGSPVAEIVDCGRAFLVAAVPQDRFADVLLGGVASFRLSGEDELRHGRVVAITGEASLTEDRNLAGVPMNGRSATAIARIEVAPSENRAGECLVGRTARVHLPARADTSVDRFLRGEP